MESNVDLTVEELEKDGLILGLIDAKNALAQSVENMNAANVKEMSGEAMIAAAEAGHYAFLLCKSQ